MACSKPASSSSGSMGTRRRRPQVAQSQKRRQPWRSLPRVLTRSPLPKRQVTQSHKLKQPKLKPKLKLKRRSSNGRQRDRQGVRRARQDERSGARRAQEEDRGRVG